MAKNRKSANGIEANNALIVEQKPEETGAQATARKLLQPALKNAAAASAFASKMMGSNLELPGIGDYADHVHAVSEGAAAGDIAMASKYLSAQAITLDSMFTELARRAALNMGEYMDASERYGRLALKAQSNCRATLEALAKLHQPREQTVRHVHVNEGGQAVIADQFHHHAGASKIGKSIKQSDATAPAGPRAALLSSDASGDGVPISSGERQAAMQDARRHKPRRA